MQLAMHGWLQVGSSVPHNTQQLVQHALRPNWVTAMFLRASQRRAAPDAAIFRKQLVVFRNIAGFHGFELLEQLARLADWLLGHHPGQVPGMAQVAEVQNILTGSFEGGRMEGGTLPDKQGFGFRPLV